MSDGRETAGPAPAPSEVPDRAAEPREESRAEEDPGPQETRERGADRRGTGALSWAEVPTAEVLARSEAALNHAEDAISLAKESLILWREALQRARTLTERDEDALVRETTAVLRALSAGREARGMAAKLARTADDLAATFDLVADSLEARASHAHETGDPERWAAARRIRHKADDERRESRALRERWHLSPSTTEPPTPTGED